MNADALPAYQSPWPPPLAGAPETTTNERHAIHNLDTLARDVGLNEGLDDLLSQLPKPESTEGGRRVSVLKRQEGAPVLLG